MDNKIIELLIVSNRELFNLAKEQENCLKLLREKVKQLEMRLEKLEMKDRRLDSYGVNNAQGI